MRRALDVSICALVWLSLAPFLGGTGFAHDHDHPDQDEWYKTLMQPDNPTMSCCGTADAYWADIVHVQGTKTFVTITDDRDDEPLKRPHMPNGTVIEVPNNKIKWDRGNPTGHAVIFLSRYPYNMVYCYVQGTGI